MYQTPAAFTRLIKDISEAPETENQGTLIIRVETGLHLATLLGLDDEPITVGWFLLSGTPTINRRLNRLNGEERRMLAVGRQIIPLNSRFAWEAALREYSTLPSQHRNYEFVATDLDKQIINACRAGNSATHERLKTLGQILNGELQPSEVKVRYPQPDKSYRVMINTETGWQYGNVKFNADQLSSVNKPQDEDNRWFSDYRPRLPITINLSDLRATAEKLDVLESKVDGNPRWVHDFDMLNYRELDDSVTPTQLAQEGKTTTLKLDGFVHLAGIVSSGKTTLVKLIAAHAIINKWDIRITMVVGDTNSALSTANQFNTWFCTDPATDQPVAVPVLGKSTRSIHLSRYQASYEYAESQHHNRPHWGERWLSPVCPLESMITWEDGRDSKIPIGAEPCTSLLSNSTATQQEQGSGEARNAGKTRAKERVPPKKERPQHHICPLFSMCPSKQMYHDMPDAKIWITTPGALTQSGVPRQLDARPIKMSELIYEQSDVVVFDEVETVMEWFDRTYTQRVDLTDGRYGLLDRLDDQVAEYLRTNRTPPPEFQKWLFAERAATKAVSTILTLLNPEQGDDLLRTWLHRGDFTQNTLSYRIARRLAGLRETSSTDPAKNNAEDGTIRPILILFEKLATNPFGLSPADQAEPQNPTEAAVRGLRAIMRQMNSAGQDVADQAVIDQCQVWITDHFPSIEADLNALREYLQTSTEPGDQRYFNDTKYDRDITDLAKRLFFTLWVVLLDWHLGIVLYEWHRKPVEIFSEQPYSKIPRGLENILPLPALGKQFAIYRAPIAGDHAVSDANRNRLSQFIFLNIGRSLLTNFHRLRTDIDGLRGPNVLALSGTSYLPDSSRFHVQIEPQGVLSTHEETRSAIRDSYFAFMSFNETPKTKSGRPKADKPIAVSGRQKKNQQLTILIEAMLEAHRQKGGTFGHVLDQLDQHAKDDPTRWTDRSRLLLFTNSYAQAKAVASALQRGWPEMREKIFYLSRGREGQDYEAQSDNTQPDSVVGSGSGMKSDNIRRIDIEQFAGTGGKILVAPMASVGRGFNILNNQIPRKAAFGAVFFLIRPMWQPHDQLAMAQELNRYTLQWATESDDVPDAIRDADGLYGGAIALRDTSRVLWQKMQARKSYMALSYPTDDPHILTATDPELNIAPLHDLAASTAGQIIQAAGRLLRGGVPFHAYFIDAAWAPLTAESGGTQPEYAQTSLLQAMIDRLGVYADEDKAIGHALYQELADKFATIVGMNGN